jgi:hypothetical protein
MMELRCRIDRPLAPTLCHRFNPRRAHDVAVGPFSNLAFTVLWTVTLVSNIGTAVFDTASGWLITSIDPIR